MFSGKKRFARSWDIFSLSVSGGDSGQYIAMSQENSPSLVAGSLALGTSDGLLLEAVYTVPSHAVASFVLCHPHPEFGGTMQAPLLLTVEQALLEKDCAVLRFNFRGTGNSEGSFAQGEGETLDVGAAVGAVDPALPLILGGWSFGGGVALRFLSENRAGTETRDVAAVAAYVGIAPAMQFAGRFEKTVLQEIRSLLLIGEKDQLVSPEKIRALAAEAGSKNELVVMKNCDHFFLGNFAKKAAQTVAAFTRATLTL